MGADSNCIDRFYVTCRKGIRRLLGLPYNTHCGIVNLICADLPIDNQIDRTCKFLASCKASDNVLNVHYLVLFHTIATTWRFNFSISSHFDRNFFVAPTVDRREYHMTCHMISLQSGQKQNRQTSAVLRLECSLDCISGSVGYQQNIFRSFSHCQRFF